MTTTLGLINGVCHRYGKTNPPHDRDIQNVIADIRDLVGGKPALSKKFFREVSPSIESYENARFSLDVNRLIICVGMLSRLSILI